MATPIFSAAILLATLNRLLVTVYNVRSDVLEDFGTFFVSLLNFHLSTTFRLQIYTATYKRDRRLTSACVYYHNLMFWSDIGVVISLRSMCEHR